MIYNFGKVIEKEKQHDEGRADYHFAGVACTEIAQRMKFIDSQIKEESRNSCAELSMMLNGLIKSLKKSDSHA